MAMSSVFSRTIVLIEDIDGVFERKEDSIEPTTKMADSCSVTFMGILNALDVVSSQEGRIVFITTNHIKVSELFLSAILFQISLHFCLKK